MSKICIFSDLHLGHKNGNSTFLNYHTQYFDKFLFPLLKYYNCNEVYFLGDFFDKRTSIDFNTADVAIDIIHKFIDKKIKLNCILGNHDIMLRNSLDISGLSQYGRMINSEYFNVIENPVINFCHNTDIICMPWVVEHNKMFAMNFIRKHAKMTKEKNTILLGHFDLPGFPMQSTILSSQGTCIPEAFTEYSQVFSGHYHLTSEKGNIMYIGSATELNWSDYLDKKRVIIYDTDTHEIKYELSTLSPIFHKIEYPDQKDIDFDIMPHCFCQIIFEDRELVFDDDALHYAQHFREKYQPDDLKIIVPNSDFDNNDEVSDTDGPETIMNNFVNGYKFEGNDIDINWIKSTFREICAEANSLTWSY